MLTSSYIVGTRLQNQLLVDSKISKPEDVVSYLVAMQAQEFAMAKWAIHLRSQECREAIIQKAFNDGLILRTHLMRPTWHFVSPADIRWLLELTAPRVHAVSAFMYRQTELTKQLISRSSKIITKSLEGGKHLTRDELKNNLAKNKIVANGHRLAYIMMNAELEGIICCGPRKGKLFTYALLEERVPPVKKLSRQEALFLLVSRYFATRGPATLKDFTTWSGLTMTDANSAAADLPGDFIREKIDGHEYIFKQPATALSTKKFPTFLMPDYDEYGMSYKERTALFNHGIKNIKAVFNHSVVIDGQIGGSWLRTVKNDVVSVETASPLRFSAVKQKAINTAVKKYLSFSNKKE